MGIFPHAHGIWGVGVVRVVFIQKIPAPIKIKSAPPSPKKPNTPLPKMRNFMGMEVVLLKETQCFQAPIKLAQPFPAPELQVGKLRT